MASCEFPNCRYDAKANGYCGKHQDYAKDPLPKKKAKRIAPVSKKRKQQNDVYYTVTLPAKLARDPYCQICPRIRLFKEAGGKADWWPVCGIQGVEAHHTKGRENERLNDLDKLLTSCDSKRYRNGHHWLDHHSEAAKKIGISLYKHQINYGEGII